MGRTMKRRMATRSSTPAAAEVSFSGQAVVPQSSPDFKAGAFGDSTQSLTPKKQPHAACLEPRAQTCTGAHSVFLCFAFLIIVPGMPIAPTTPRAIPR